VKRTPGSTYYLAAAVALLTLLVYLRALRNQFVNWDDDRYIFENLHIRSIGMEFFRWAFFDFHASNWHPLTWISHALDYALWGLNPLGHHLTSIILHAVNTALVVLLAERLFKIASISEAENGPPAFLSDRTVLIAAGITALLFGLHPVHVESVAWIMERKDLLCALFFLLSIMAYLSYAEGVTLEDKGKGTGGRRSVKRLYLATLGLFLLALLSKPMAVTLPAVLLILDWHPLGRVRSFRTVWAVVVEKLPFIALSIASSVITIAAQRSGGAVSSLDVVPLSTRLLVAAKALAAYLGKMLLPLDLIPFYPYPRNVSLASWEYLLAFGLVCGVTAVCVIVARRRKAWLSVWGYYVVTLVPVLGIIQVGGQSMADRYTYLPSLSPLMIVGATAAWLAAKLKDLRHLDEYRSFVALALIVAVPLSYATVRQIDIWHDSISLWNRVLDKEPEVHIAYVNRGIAYMKLGQLDKALGDFNKVISFRPDAKAFYHRALVFTKLNLLPQAISDYSLAVGVNPSYYDAYNNRGVIFQGQGRYDEALADYNAAIALRPSNFQAYVNRGLVLERVGQIDSALADFDRAVALNPRNPEGYYNRGLLLFDRYGQPDRALADFGQAIKLNPGDPDAYYHRGRVLTAMVQYANAIADFDRAIALDPGYYVAYRDRGMALQKSGQPDKAARDFAIWKEHPKKN
jgi:tetratricopeptide (TPR) repeat protein